MQSEYLDSALDSTGLGVRNVFPLCILRWRAGVEHDQKINSFPLSGYFGQLLVWKHVVRDFLFIIFYPFQLVTISIHHSQKSKHIICNRISQTGIFMRIYNTIMQNAIIIEP